MYRIGEGYDTHRLVEGRKLILAGVTIPYPKGLLGHSDADVLTHAIIDSILGALALGDIGRHFPDSDDRFKGISSIVLLKEAKKIIGNVEICNIDSTVICEMPKLMPYIDSMRDNIAKALEIDVSRVSIKATTDEGLGFTGEGLGIVARAITLINDNL